MTDEANTEQSVSKMTDEIKREQSVPKMINEIREQLVPKMNDEIKRDDEMNREQLVPKMTDEMNRDPLVPEMTDKMNREQSFPTMTDEIITELSVPEMTGEINADNSVPVPVEQTEEMAKEIRNEPTIPVPRMYKEAVKILKRYENKESTLKNLVYNCKFKSFKLMYGLMCNAVENYSSIQTILAECKLLTEQPRFNPTLAHILIAELLGSGHLEGECKPILVLNEYAEKIKHLASTIGFKVHTDEGKNLNPRYVRINTLLCTVDGVHAQLAQQGWMLVKYDPSQVTYDEFLDFIENIDESCYLQDYHIPNLLVFRQGTNFWGTSLYKDHMIVLQDKACCLPVFLSSLRVGARVIDACASPGSKTSHMAAVMRNTGRIKAYDKVFKRYKLLLKNIAQRGAKCVFSNKQDFTKIYPERHRDVEYIFIDPPCSSSGLDFQLDEETMGRVWELAKVQLQLLVHALSFPSVKRVIYSTCSINVEENEKVVEEALRQYHHQFDLEDLKQKLPGWKHFGNEKFECGSRCIKTVSEVDKCQGFFVAIFVRKGSQYGQTGNETGMKRKWTAGIDYSNNQTHYHMQHQAQYHTPHQMQHQMPQNAHHQIQQQGQQQMQQQGQQQMQQQGQQQMQQQGQQQMQQQGQQQMQQQGQQQMQQQRQQMVQQQGQQQMQQQGQQQGQQQMQQQGQQQMQQQGQQQMQQQGQQTQQQGAQQMQHQNYHQNLHQVQHQNQHQMQYQNHQIQHQNQHQVQYQNSNQVHHQNQHQTQQNQHQMEHQNQHQNHHQVQHQNHHQMQHQNQHQNHHQNQHQLQQQNHYQMHQQNHHQMHHQNQHQGHLNQHQNHHETQHQTHQNQHQMQHQNQHQAQHQNHHQAQQNQYQTQHQNQYDGASWNYQSNNYGGYGWNDTNNAKKRKSYWE